MATEKLEALNSDYDKGNAGENIRRRAHVKNHRAPFDAQCRQIRLASGCTPLERDVDKNRREPQPPMPRSYAMPRVKSHCSPVARLCWYRMGAQFAACVVVVALAADLAWKDPSNLEQVVWSCYWSALTIAVGIFVHSDFMVSSAFIFFIGLGTPAWIVGRVLEHEIDPTSLLIHTVPVLAGGLYLLDSRMVPAKSAVGAWMLHALPLGCARLLCDPAENINLCARVWPPIARFIPGLWEFHAVALCLSASMFTLAVVGLRHLLLPQEHRRVSLPLALHLGLQHSAK